MIALNLFDLINILKTAGLPALTGFRQSVQRTGMPLRVACSALAPYIGRQRAETPRVLSRISPLADGSQIEECRMKITTFKSHVAPQLSALVADPKQQFALSPEIAAVLGIAPRNPIPLPGGLVLQTLAQPPVVADPQPVVAKGTLDMTGHVTKIGALTLDYAKSQFPGISPQLDGAIGGVQVALLGIAAAKAWSEVDDKGYTKAVLTTSSAALEMLKLVQDAIPGFERLGPTLAMVSFLVKVGDEICQVNMDIEAMKDSPAK